MKSKIYSSVLASILLLGVVASPASGNDSAVSTAISLPRQERLQDPSSLSFPSAENRPRSTVYEGAKWTGHSVITWSIATTPGTTDAPFSGYMGPQYEALIKQAFDTWAAASGLSFQEMPDSSVVDLRFGWSRFNTVSTGIVGHTACQALSGEMLPNGIIRLEDPAENALVEGQVNILMYSGTTASLYQVMLHEIGHALGLADNSDPRSIMYFEATAMNMVLANDDVTGIRELYGVQVSPVPALRVVAPELSDRKTMPKLAMVNPSAASFRADQKAGSLSVSASGR